MAGMFLAHPALCSPHRDLKRPRLTSSFGFAIVLLPDFNPSYLAADGLWEGLHELNDPGVLVGCRHLLDVVLKLELQVVGGLVHAGQNHRRLHHLTPQRVGGSTLRTQPR
jgi:hypothetical protein